MPNYTLPGPQVYPFQVPKFGELKTGRLETCKIVTGDLDVAGYDWGYSRNGCSRPGLTGPKHLRGNPQRISIHMSTISSFPSICIAFQARVLKRCVRLVSCSFCAQRLRLRSVEVFPVAMAFILSGFHVLGTQVLTLSSLITPNFEIEK